MHLCHVHEQLRLAEKKRKLMPLDLCLDSFSGDLYSDDADVKIFFNALPFVIAHGLLLFHTLCLARWPHREVQ